MTALLTACAGVTALPNHASAAAGDISTIAGTGTNGYSGDGGPATSAELAWPLAVESDGVGNLYIAEAARIRKVSATGTISTIAGTGTNGYSGDGGPATSAQLSNPTALALDNSGNLYVADSSNARVRRISASGTITTAAGTGTTGYSGDGGPATSAQLDTPSGVAVDSAGNLYISDRSNHRIRKVDATGSIATVVGTGVAGSSGDGGPASAAQVQNVNGLAFDAADQLYLADDHRVRRVDSSGAITTVAGSSVPGFSGDGGAATAAHLRTASDVDVRAGELYVADNGNERIRKVHATGVITTVAGDGTAGYSGDGGPATMAQLNNPVEVVVGPAGNLLIADMFNNRVRSVEPSTGPLPTTSTAVTTSSVPLPTTTSVPLPSTTVPGPTTTTLPPLVGTGYPSDACAAGSNVFTGFASGAYTSVRTSTSGSSTSVCAVLEQGAVHVGGRVTVSSAVPGVPMTDGNSAACADPAMSGEYVLVRDVSVLGRPFRIDAKVRSNEAWVCVRADTVTTRVVVPTTVSGLPSFSADSSAPHVPAYPPTPPPVGKASSACRQGGGESGRVLNATAGTTPAWAYTWQESPTRAHVCVRADGAAGDGGRLTLDGNGGVTLVAADSSSDRGPCPQQIVDDAGPPPSWIYTSNPGVTPAWACVRLDSTYVRLKLDTGGGQGIVTFTRDT